MIGYLKAMYDFSPWCKIFHVQTLHNPVVPGLALSHRSRMPYMQSKSRFTNLRIRLSFHQINRRSHLPRRQHGSWPASPKSISISTSVSEEQNCKQEVNEEPSRVIYYRRPARTSRETVCSGVIVLAQQNGEHPPTLFW